MSSIVSCVTYYVHSDVIYIYHSPMLTYLQLRRLESSLKDANQKLEESKDELKTNENGKHHLDLSH